ncbi:tetratricopeptide repeat protein [Streptomyces antibioticus]|uniref:tetratricopeptide repeat protein n=1 Tax=Streptomyces antibioticus TaxID=1890 RepID=UPI0037214870
MTSHGTPFLDGRRIMTRDRPVISAVLDALQERAIARGAPVRGTVEDRQEGIAVVVTVAPDGSSTLEHSARTARRRPAKAPLRGDDTAASHEPSGTNPQRRADRAAPAPSAPPDSATVRNPPPAPPAELADVLSRIAVVVASGDLEEAVSLASALTAQARAAYGNDHPYTLEASASEAYVACLAGRYADALTLSVRVAGLLHRRDDPRAWRELARGAAAWLAAEDRAASLGRAEQLVELYTRMKQHGPPPSDCAELLERVTGEIRDREPTAAPPPYWE